MNIAQDTDTDNGKGAIRQTILALFYLAFLFLGFYVIRTILLGLISFGFGESAATAFFSLSQPIAFFLTILLFALGQDNFWVNPGGNRVLATINIFFPKQLPDGGTLFTVYSAGFALVWPWERPFGDEVEIEREEFHCPPLFTVTVKKTALEIIMKIAWKPYKNRLSSFLQNATHKDEYEGLLGQIAAKAATLTEQFASRYGSAEEVRENPTQLIADVQRETEKFAQGLGITIFDISFLKCDYDAETQKRLNKHIETQVVAEITAELIKQGVPADKAPELAAVMAGVAGVKINRTVFEVVASDQIAAAITNLGPIAQAWLAKQESK